MYKYPIVDNYLSSLCCFIILQGGWKMRSKYHVICIPHFQTETRCTW